MQPFQTIQIHHMKENQTHDKHMPVTTEAPLNICINTYLFDQIMRTPGDEKAHIAGLLFSHQIITTRSDLKAFSVDTSDSVDTVKVTVSTPFSPAFFYQKTNNIPEINRNVNQKLSYSQATICIDDLNNCQPLRSQTRSTHAAILFDNHFNRIASKEDVGRHNALDKVIGQAILDQRLESIYLLVLSSRVSHELMMKVLRTPIKYILSVSRPTSLAINLARKNGIHLACLSKDEGFLIFTGMDGFCQTKNLEAGTSSLAGR
ncbi:Formate dehydrogenase, subunit FdhD [Candidatus Magnetomorum sp. HK-1]|nr:Formate dehydrogenase, subunit FdhD [Candidatus Magnetomorum sp. HK-1]